MASALAITSPVLHPTILAASSLDFDRVAKAVVEINIKLKWECDIPLCLSRLLSNREMSFIAIDAASALIQGYVVCRMEDKDTAYVSFIAVDPEVQRAGVGTQLMKAALIKCRSIGYKKLFLDFEASNEKTRRFYESVPSKVLGAVKVEAVFTDAGAYLDGTAKAQVSYTFV